MLPEPDAVQVDPRRERDGQGMGAWPAQSGAGALAFDGSSLWVAYTVDDYVTRLRASDRTELGTFAVGGFDHHRSGGVAFDGSSIWVFDRCGGQGCVGSNLAPIQKFDASGTFITSWGGPGSLSGQFASPLGVAVDGDGNVYVADTGNDRIQKFLACP